MSSFFKAVDTMSYNPNLKINGKKSYKTVFGGILTSSLLILSIIGLIYFGRELWEKNNAIIVSSVVNFDASNPFLFGPDDFYGFLTLQDKDLITFIDDSIYTIVPIQTINYKDENGKVTNKTIKLEYDRCIKYYNQLNHLPRNMKVDYENAYCIRPYTANITGLWGTHHSEEIYISYYKCNNSTSKITCKSPEEIHNKIHRGFITLNLLNNQLQPKNYTHPIISFLSDTWNNINLETSTEMIVYLKELNIITDDGFLIESKNIKLSYFFENPRFIYYGRNQDGESKFYKIAFKREFTGIQINRVYIKIQEIVTKIGGLIKFLGVVGQMMISLSSEIEFYNDFSFNLTERLKLIKPGNSITIKKKNTIDDSKIKLASSQNNYSKKIEDKNESKIDKYLNDFNNPNLNIEDKSNISNNKLNQTNMFINSNNSKVAETVGEKVSPNVKTQKFIHNNECYEKKSKSNNIISIDDSNSMYSTVTAFKNFIEVSCCIKNEFTKKIKNLTMKNNIIISLENMIEKYFQIEYIIDKLKNVNDDFNEKFNFEKIEYEYLEKIHENFDLKSKSLFFN